MNYVYAHGHYPHQFMYGGYGFHFGGFLFLLLIILTAYLLYKAYKRRGCCSSSSSTHTCQGDHKISVCKTPLEILETRLVNSEITVEEFLTMKKAMQQDCKCAEAKCEAKSEEAKTE